MFAGCRKYILPIGLAGLCLITAVVCVMRRNVKDDRPEFTVAPLQEQGMTLEEVSVEIPGLAREYHFLYLSDLHIILESKSVAAKNLENVRGRIQWFSSSDQTSAEMWTEDMPAMLDACHADAVWLGGDMVDFCAPENLACFKEGLDRLATPYLYVRADHDTRPFYCEGLSRETCAALHTAIDGDVKVRCEEYPEFCVVGLSDSTSQMTQESLDRMKEIFAKGKPIILLTHVPYNSLLSEDLANASKASWQDRILTWGGGARAAPMSRMPLPGNSWIGFTPKTVLSKRSSAAICTLPGMALSRRTHTNMFFHRHSPRRSG